MPPKDWKSGRPEGFVKAVRLTQDIIDRVAQHTERLQAQLPFVRVTESDALRHLVQVGLETVEAGLPQPQPRPTAVELPLGPQPVDVRRPLEESQGLSHAPSPVGGSRSPHKVSDATLQNILDTAEEYNRLSLLDLSQLLYDRSIYRARDRKTGEEKPVNRGTLQKWLEQARAARGTA